MRVSRYALVFEKRTEQAQVFTRFYRKAGESSRELFDRVSKVAHA